MTRTSALSRVEWLLVGAQAVVLVVLLGFPDVGGATNVFTSGYLTGANAVALITTLLWACTVVVVAAVGLRVARGALHPRSRSAMPVIAALVVGASCATAGALRHQSSSFDPCCGSVQRAQTSLEGIR